MLIRIIFYRRKPLRIVHLSFILLILLSQWCTSIYIFICWTTQETLSAHASARRSSGRWNNKFCCRHKIHTTSDYVQNAQKPTFLLCCGTSFRHVSTKRLRFEVVDVAWQLLLLVLVMLMLRDIPLNSFWGRSGKLLDTDFLKFQESSGDFVS